MCVCVCVCLWGPTTLVWSTSFNEIIISDTVLLYLILCKVFLPLTSALTVRLYAVLCLTISLLTCGSQSAVCVKCVRCSDIFCNVFSANLLTCLFPRLWFAASGFLLLSKIFTNICSLFIMISLIKHVWQVFNNTDFTRALDKN